jgi:hypothetical protein
MTCLLQTALPLFYLASSAWTFFLQCCCRRLEWCDTSSPEEHFKRAPWEITAVAKSDQSRVRSGVLISINCCRDSEQCVLLPQWPRLRSRNVPRLSSFIGLFARMISLQSAIAADVRDQASVF